MQAKNEVEIEKASIHDVVSVIWRLGFLGVWDNTK